ncbi:MAG: Trimeric GatFAB AmidoTransferase(AdT) complex subunit [Trizodia sp. TS-e1964]|nr:MAG: Trimeric GatFAB AmidoTransferase(AdT) complex subunit [Trizodia sp. TS-e1964]
MSLLRDAERCLQNQLLHKSLNAFVTGAKRDERLLNSLREADTRLRDGKSRSSIDGKLIAIKDNIATKGFPTTCASRLLKDFVSPFNATVVEKLLNLGAVVGGKTNMDEFGMGSNSTHSFFGNVQSFRGEGPEALSAGGSSGGSAVAVATHQCFAAIGTDTGGSVRQPAAYTGIVGFKPSYGMISRLGIVPYANSLDTVGVLARDISSVRSVFDAVNGYDSQDPTSLSLFSRLRIAQQKPKYKHRGSFRVGIPSEYNVEDLDPVIRKIWLQSISFLKEHGHSIHQVSLPSTKQALSAYYVIAPAEASSNLAKYDGVRYGTRDGDTDDLGGILFANTRGKGFGEEVRRRILLGTYSLSAAAIDNYFIQAQKVRRIVQQDFDKIFNRPNPLRPSNINEYSNHDRVDVLLCPTVATSPPTLSSLAGQAPLEAYASDIFTVPASLAGLPAITVPVSFEPEINGLPIGMQIIAQYGDDDLVLDVASCLVDPAS